MNARTKCYAARSRDFELTCEFTSYLTALRNCIIGVNEFMREYCPNIYEYCHNILEY